VATVLDNPVHHLQSWKTWRFEAKSNILKVGILMDQVSLLVATNGRKVALTTATELHHTPPDIHCPVHDQYMSQSCPQKF